MNEPREAMPYTQWVWDCPACGAQNGPDDAEPSAVETCYSCDNEVTMI